MQYRKMKKTNEELSILGYGCMRLPEKNNKIDEENAKKQLLHAIDKGVNYIDTAFPYHMGESEPFLGRALTGGFRQKVKLATKLPQFLVKNRDDMDVFFNKQLRNLKTDYIDYYLIHSLDGPSWKKMKEFNIFDFMDKIKKTGKIKHIGFSFHGKSDDFKCIIDDYNWDFCQIQYNFLDEKNQAGKDGLKYAAAKDLGVVIMEPLRGGMLTNNIPEEVTKIWDKSDKKWSPAEWALRWIWNHPEVTVVLSGMNNMEHINENLRIAKDAKAETLMRNELELVNRVKDKYRELMKVNCTGCRYCMPCPAGVNIPMCFEVFNNRYLTDKKFYYKVEYGIRMGGLVGEKGFASKCIDCGKCEKHCPQHIEIRKELNNVKKEFENFALKFIIFFGKIFMSGMRKKALKK